MIKINYIIMLTLLIMIIMISEGVNIEAQVKKEKKIKYNKKTDQLDINFTDSGMPASMLIKELINISENVTWKHYTKEKKFKGYKYIKDMT